MESNVAANNEPEHEDIIYDVHTLEEDNKRVKEKCKKSLALVVQSTETNIECELVENNPEREIQDIPTENASEEIDVLMEQLPDSFPEAEEAIKKDLAPLLINCAAGIRDHYVKVIKRKTNAASIKSVSILVNEAIESISKRELFPDEDKTYEAPVDPEVQEFAEQIAQDPMLFNNKINIINKFGVRGERKNIGMNFLVFDSCLLPMGRVGSDALAMKNSGHYGAGKSFPLFMCMKLYPKTAYHLITSGSDKSMYSIQGGLKHKALILAEALALESYGNRDNELAYSIRSLTSEGHLKYQYTGFKDKKKVTIIKKMEGPTSLLTTTIKGKLEDQLEDRLITVHPNTSAEQTQDIIERTAELAAGDIETVDNKTIKAWKVFYESLNPIEVVIPFSKDLATFVNKKGSLPISARRAFKRVLSAIKTISLLYQKQRCIDDLGRVIADYIDYAMAFQLIEESFRESLGEGKRYTDERIRIIWRNGIISPKNLSKVTGVTVAAISQWMKPWITKGVLTWCDENGNEFSDVKSLEKSKRSGKAFIRIGIFNRLPTPYQLTGDKRWDIGGDLYQMYNLGFDTGTNSETVQYDTDVILPSTSDKLVKPVDPVISQNDEDNGVKALSEKEGNENKNLKKYIPVPEDKTKTKELCDEFGTILSNEKQDIPGTHSKDVTNPPGIREHKNEVAVDGILTI